jgi:hypothetical protein
MIASSLPEPITPKLETSISPTDSPARSESPELSSSHEDLMIKTTSFFVPKQHLEDEFARASSLKVTPTAKVSIDDQVRFRETPVPEPQPQHSKHLFDFFRKSKHEVCPLWRKWQLH